MKGAKKHLTPPPPEKKLPRESKDFFPSGNDPSLPEKSKISGPVAGARARNAFWVIHPPFFSFFFDGESSFYNWAVSQVD